jgi:hypothetical protein
MKENIILFPLSEGKFHLGDSRKREDNFKTYLQAAVREAKAHTGCSAEEEEKIFKQLGVRM